MSSNPNSHFDFTPSSGSDRGTIKVPKLSEDGANWVTYKTELISAVGAKGLKRYLTGVEKQPVPPTAPGVDPDADDKYESAVDIWESKHDTIKSLLYQTIPETLKLKIVNLKRASEAWKVICDRFDNQGDFVQVNILDRMQALRVEDNADPRPILNELEKLKTEYATAGGDLKDDQYKVMIIGRLPKSYRESVRTIMASTRHRVHPTTGQSWPLTPSELIDTIHDIARDDSALDSSRRPNDAALTFSSGSKVIDKETCANCGKKGHWKKDCWSKGGGKEGKGPGRKRGKRKQQGQGGENANAAGTSSRTIANEGYAFIVATDFSKVASTPLPPHARLLDSGASRHFEPKRENFVTFSSITPKPINSADGRVFHATGEGDVPVTVTDGQRTVTLTLKNVLFVPTMPIPLISVSKMVQGGFLAHFEKDGCHILSPTRTKLLIVKEQLGLYPVLVGKMSQAISTARIENALTTTLTTLTLTEFHRSMGHAYPAALRKMVTEGIVTGVVLEGAEAEFCDACVQAKHTREPFPKERLTPPTKIYGERIHSDVWGKSQVKTLGGKEYFISFLDDFTDEAVVVLMSRKAEALTKYKFFEAWAKNQRGVSEIKVLQSDRGGEYVGNEFRDYLASKGTERRLTTHDSPQQNGKAERLNRTLVEHVRAMLFDAKLPKFLWGEALMHATFLRNRTTTRNTPASTPLEKATGIKPDLSFLPRFGAKVWVHVEGSGKLDPKSVEGHWVGFDSDSKAHRIYFQAKRSVSVERNVRFEPEMISTSSGIRSEGEQATNIVQNAPNVPPKMSPITPTPLPPPSIKSDPITPPKSAEVPGKSSGGPVKSKEDTQVIEESSGRTRRPSRWIRDLQSGTGSLGGRGAQKLPQSIIPSENAKLTLQEMPLDNFLDVQEPLFALATMSGDELTHQEAMDSPEKDLWRQAQEEELRRVEEMGTFELVEKPLGVNVVGSVWVLKKKRDENNHVVKYKARLCAQGFSQIPGIDFGRTSAPTARLSSLRFILALAATQDWEIHQIDFKNAYLNGELDETIYMRQPPGFQAPGRKDWVWKLHKAIYGLKQAGHQWYLKVRELFEDLGLMRCENDQGVFYLHLPEFSILVAVHVDDCTIVASSLDVMKHFKHEIGLRFEVSDLGEVRWLLGFEIHRDRHARTLSLSQRSYIDTLLDRFNLKDANPVATPLDPHTNLYLPITDSMRSEMRQKPYSQLVGSLMYAAIGTRPDIAFTTSTLAQFMSDPAPFHWEAAKRVVRYLKGTQDYSLTFGGEILDLIGYTDADWGSQSHRHSISGHVYLFSGGAISWSSRKQPIIALSSTEAEYIAASDAVRELLWLRSFISEITIPIRHSITLLCDNQSAIQIASNGLINARTKHIDIRIHFIRNIIESGVINLVYCPTDQMLADIFTKALPRPRVEYLAGKLGLRPA